MLAETLFSHAESARVARQAAIEASAKAVGVRCVLPLVLCFLPAFLLLGIIPTVVSAFLANVPAVLGGR
jgi:pilus assembly protein TadC